MATLQNTTIPNGGTIGSVSDPDAISISSAGSVTITQDLNPVNFVGMIAAFAVDTAPTGWLICDGSSLNAVTYPTYANLHNILKDVGGVNNYGWGGSSSSAFNIPDLRGEFLRGWDDGAGNDGTSGRTFASNQAAAIKKYNMHIFTNPHTGGGNVVPDNEYQQGSGTARLQIVNSGYPINYGGYQSSTYFTVSMGHSDVGVGFHLLRARVGDPYGHTSFTPSDPTNSYNSALSEIGNGEETRPRNVAVQYCIKF